MSVTPPEELAEAREAYVDIANAARRYRASQRHGDETGDWEPAREAAVVLDACLARVEGK